MLSTYLTVYQAIENVSLGLEVKGNKTGLQRNKIGFTCYARSLKIIKQYANATSSVPYAASIANKFLEENNL